MPCSAARLLTLVALLTFTPIAAADAPAAPGSSASPGSPAAPAAPGIAAPGIAVLPHVIVDIKNHRVSVDCQALNITAPLEFFCVEDGGNEHESVLRTPAKASDIHTALLMLGLKPGGNVRYVQSNDTWLPPYGPPLHIFCDYLLNSRRMHVPAYRMMRSITTQQEPPAFTWVFCGSKVMSDGAYAADVTSYVVSVVNFDYTLIDVPNLKSNSNDTLEWEENPDLVPPKGTPVTMIIEPAGYAEDVGPVPPGASAMDTPAPPTVGQHMDMGPGVSPGDSTGAAPAPAPPAANANAPTASTAPPGPTAPTPNGPILLKLITIDAAGNVAIDHAPTNVDQLTDLLENLKKTGLVKATIAADENAPRDTLDKVIVAVANADIPMDFATAPTDNAALTADANTASTANTGAATSVAASSPPAPASPPTYAAEIAADQARIDALKQQWEQAVAPHRDALRAAAQAHYDIINAMRRQQQHLIDEADHIQRTIDDLEKQYEDMTTPAPPPLTTEPADQPDAGAAPGQ